ncbi:DNA-directed RNA polymerase II subunit GRINL1A-like isoform X2 [Rattus rattus]|uniref:DNA-directed RNA polymerase II subunit GRINL1A-like isoform X2 n=1 Tax=Rattus rattus TaxID=10117 RepID=UPI0013F3270D|nr:DNA-directed RNA polymerase II subunit GRINL1A-like isoform X2 [Rattus rattus]
MCSLPCGFQPPAPEDLGKQSSAELRERLRRQERLLRNKLQKITTADQTEPSEENTSTENFPGLQSETPKKPHYMTVLEMRARNPVPPPHKFKTNVLPTQQSDSPSHCQRAQSPASSEEQRCRARQHLDDVTAAHLLLLHPLPAQLLSIEESLALQKAQKQNYEEMRAKLAAQKLAQTEYYNAVTIQKGSL